MSLKIRDTAFHTIAAPTDPQSSERTPLYRSLILLFEWFSFFLRDSTSRVGCELNPSALKESRLMKEPLLAPSPGLTLCDDVLRRETRRLISG